MKLTNGDAFVYESCHINEIHILNGQMNCVMHE